MELKPGDKICKECNGSGIINPEKRFDGGTIVAICSSCDGDGKFDWIEQVVGKKQFIKNPDKSIIARVDAPDNPQEEDFYFDTTLKMPMIFINNKWKPFDYFGANFETKIRRN